MSSKLDINKTLESIAKISDSLSGIPSGFESLDVVTSGFQSGSLYILAGGPAMGKSALAINIARKAAVEFNKGVAYFTLEQGEKEITYRLIAAETETSLDKLNKGGLADYEWEHITLKTNRLIEAPIFIGDYPKLTTDKLAAECRKLVEGGTELIILDDIQRVTLNSEQKKLAVNREQEVSIVVRELKALAKELNVPILAISQLNRSVEGRGGDRRPILSDLRDSGALENDSDMVIFLYRPEKYGIMESEEGMPLQGVCDLIIAKHRYGSLDTVQLKFIDKYTRFTDLNVQAQFKNMGSYPPISSLGHSKGAITLGSKLNENEKRRKKPGSGFGYKDFPDDDAPF